MGLIEVHFHESEFDFSPSMVTGAGEQALEATEEESDETADEDVESVGWKDEEAEPSSSAGLGALVALAVLVVLAALVGLKRRSSGDEDGELEA
ncbi:hypothetical protein [Halobacterium noricense]|uniref:hypothetical protein n=1 Tax=Halobacterium noricense TaxID=223182 RepID=UPI001E2F7B13|nr:hypothetical protein [Halobacterium noricense]UHH24476.1 hypothetical protein LT974_10815 [Halobacterium noricense]